MKCGLRMKKQLSIESADERHASVDARIKHRAMKESGTKRVNDSASHDKHRRCYAPDTTDGNYAVTLPTAEVG